MNTPRALLIPAALALLSACGGGGNEPPPELIWQATASSSGIPEEPTGRTQWSPQLIAAGGFTPARPFSGEACIEGTWSQTLLHDATVEIAISTAGLPLQQSGSRARFVASGLAGATLSIPFRICRPAEGPGLGTLAVEAFPRAICTIGNFRCLGAYSVNVRWSVVGAYR
jgi:hypothetical protein